MPLQGRFARNSDPSGQLEVLADSCLRDRAALAQALGIPPDESDAGLILGAYRRWGADLCRHLQGEFAFAILDRGQGSVLLGRDHMGFRTLFYTQDGESLLIANEPGSLVASSNAPQFDEAYAVMQLLGGRRVEAHRTFWKGIERLPAGHHLLMRDGNWTREQWWKPFEQVARRDGQEAELVEQGRELLQRAIADSIPAQGRVGIHVTGGLDSSAILVIGDALVRQSGRQVTGYAWQGPSETEEGPRIAAAAALVEMDLRIPDLSDREFADLWRSDWSVAPSQWNLMHELPVQRDAGQNGISTILSGWGGDEAISFNGRGIHAEYLAQLKLADLAALSPHSGIKGLASSLRAALSELREGRRNELGVAPGTFLTSDALAQVDIQPGPVIDYSSCRTAMRSILDTGATSARIEDWAISGHEHGVRYRYPMLDRRVMEFAYSLPGELFRQGPTRRWFFREMMKGILPENIRCETSKRERLRTTALERRLQQFYRGIAEEVEDRRSSLARAHFFDMDRLIAALRNPPGIGEPQFGHLRRAIQFLDI
ncbi:asparagine synthetase B [Erythrobacter sp. HKB08]|uniref:asparagine synthetase B family protein n=1 Tax=Erythrobacter sp. HKB08 TaxID=2502843 RepID=UPI001F29EEC2|nr:asparagine synthase-related protein [Erythrobacter sp. HKB08]